MLPFFPSLRPSVSSSICFDVDTPCDDESELREMEKEHVAWVRFLIIKCLFLFWSIIFKCADGNSLPLCFYA